MKHLIAIINDRSRHTPIMPHQGHSVREIPASSVEAASADERRTSEAANGSH